MLFSNCVRSSICFLMLCACFATADFARASATVVVKAQDQSVDVVSHLEFLSAEKELATFNVAKRSELWAPYVGNQSEVNQGLGNKSWWFRFKIHSALADEREMFLEIDGTWLDEILIYQMPGYEKVIELGDEKPFEQRFVKTPTFVIPFQMKQNRGDWIYIRVASLDPIIFGIDIKDARTVIESSITNRMYIGAYVGLLLGMIFYNLFIYLSVRDVSYIYYILFELFLGIHFMATFGLGFEYLWSDSPMLQNRGGAWWVYLAGIFLLQYVRSFLRLDQFNPLYDRIARWILWGTVASAIAIQFIDRYHGWIVNAMNMAIITSVGTFFVVTAYLKGVKSARFVIIGWATVFVGGIFYVVGNLFDLYNTYQVRVGLLGTSAFEMILFSLALSDRINFLEKEKQAVEEQSEFRERHALIKGASEERLKNISEFAAISHEFRTPLTLILGPLADLLEKANDQQKVQLNLIKRNALRLQRFVDQILEISRLQVSVSEEKQAYDVRQTLRPLLESFHTLAEKDGIDYRYDIDGDAVVECLPDTLDSIITNLVSNAFKYIGGGGAISVQIRCDSKQVVLTVADDGIGIAKDKHEIIFNRFAQVRSDNEAVQYGAGIGLSLVKQLVDFHEGQIDIESELSQGTRLIISLPCSPTAVPTLDMTRQALSLSDEAYSFHDEVLIADDEQSQEVSDSKPTVLVVDDDSDMLLYLQSCLNGQFNCVASESAEAALAIAKEIQPDVIISDVMMEPMNGIVFCEKIKNDVALNHIPFLLLTAQVGMEAKINGLSVGADDYLNKPFNANELRLRTQNFIRNRDRIRRRFSEFKGDVAEAAVSDKDNEFIELVRSLVQAELSNASYDYKALADDLNLTVRTLQNKAKAMTGETPNSFIQLIRIEEAEKLMRARNQSVKQLAYQVGFESPAYFSRVFKKRFGVTPSEYGEQFLHT